MLKLSGIRMALSLFGLSLLFGAKFNRAQDDYSVSNTDVAAVSYTLTPIISGAASHIDVRLTFSITGDPEKLLLQMPVWSPGDYHYQNHGKYVQNLTAVALTGGGRKVDLMVTHPDQNTWEISPGKATKIQVSYSVPETPAGIFSENVQLQPHFGFINGPAAFVYLVNHKDLKSQVTIVSPTTWKSTMPLPTIARKDEITAKPDFSTATYIAPDYDSLADSPIVFADDTGMKVYKFNQDGTDFDVVCFRNPGNIKNPPDLIDALKKIAHTETALMGGMPTRNYNFIFDVDGFSAGLEHLNSFRIGLRSQAPPNQLSAFIGHEFFHQWNVKRIRPLVLGPFDYVNAPKTHNLWFAEGVTEYYAQICSHRSGFVTAASLMNHYRFQISRMTRNPAHKTITAEESSMRVWESGDSQGFGELSYYDKGELIGLCLDFKIRAATEGKKSLDDVMRLLMKRHAPPLPGYGEDEIRITVNEVAGVDCTQLYNTIVRSTDEMPFAELAGPFGMTGDMRPIAAATPEQIALRNGWLEGNAP